ncbi:hydrocephalus-inducing protein homolog [Prorops nasuta]|uniref:hydrocephalus-inducing protein homolog n=1 Tax=Prorops nasuta TaxID=863751 RepID=UPI0034CFCDC1
MNSCFINFPYSRNLVIINSSSIDGYFYFVPQEVSEMNATVYSLSIYQGYVKAGEKKNIQLTIMTGTVGHQMVTLCMKMLGEKLPVSYCEITCNGQGPVVSVEPECLNFGKVKLHVETPFKFSIVNHSPIPAYCKLNMTNKNSPWFFSKHTYELKANCAVEIELRLVLHETGKYTDNVLLSVVNSEVTSFPVLANGVGCCIVFQPEIQPVFDMGLLLSQYSYNDEKHEYSAPSNYLDKYANVNYSKRSHHPTTLFLCIPKSSKKFQVIPFKINLLPGETREVQCKIDCGKSKVIMEDWYIYCYTREDGRRELLCTSTFKAAVVKSKILFSKRKIIFHQNMPSMNEKINQRAELFVTNESQLNLHARLSVDPPFSLITELEESVNQMNVVLLDQATTRIKVSFSPSVKNICSSKIYRSLLCFEYLEHSSKDKLKCRGYLDFPDIALSTTNIEINCLAGCSTHETLFLNNDGSVPVNFSFKWIKESIKIQYHKNLLSRLGQSRGPCNRADELLDVHLNGSGDASSILTVQGNSHVHPTSVNDVSANEGWSTEAYIPLNIDSNEQNVTESEIKQFLFPLIDQYFFEDTEIPAIEGLDTKPFVDNYINEMLNIVPYRGTIFPNSSQEIYFIFYGLQPLKVQAVAFCDIENGPSKEILISATSDVIIYNIDKNSINFGKKLFCDCFRENITLRNDSMIPFIFKVEIQLTNNNQLNLLKVLPCQGTLSPKSSIDLEIIYHPMVIGTFKTSFDLKIDYLPPTTIHIEGIGTLPQIYVWATRECNSRQDILDGYLAFSMIADFEEKAKIPDEEGILSDWNIISRDENIPGSIDIEMAIERFQADRFVQQNIQLIMDHAKNSSKAGPIPSLFSPEYIIDLHSIVINDVTKHSVNLINYGFPSAEIKLKKLRDKDSVDNSGIIVRLEKSSNFRLRNNSLLQIICQPKRANYPERITEIKHTFNLEITNGYTLPIVVKGLVTYPYLTSDIHHLNFECVTVGECLMMSFIIENTGLEVCNWEAKLLNTRKKGDEMPFFLKTYSGTTVLNQKDIIKVYFQPRKTLYAKATLEFTVKMGLETLSVTLVGRGVQNTLAITDSTISFEPTVPSIKVQEKIFQIENESQHPVECFWHHLDKDYLNDMRAMDAFLYYHQLEQTLLPRRKLGDRLPEEFKKFYEDLLREAIQNFQSGESYKAFEIDEMDDEEIRWLLHRYIDVLHSEIDCHDKIENSLKDIFKRPETCATSSSIAENVGPDEKILIIFHGAPFTKYQEAACKTAKLLDVPLLDLDKLILEIIAFCETSYGLELQQIIDETYNDLLLIIKKLRQEQRSIGLNEEEPEEVVASYRQNTPKSGKMKSSKGMASSVKSGKGNAESERKKIEEVPADFELLTNLLVEFDKIPSGKKLEELDHLSRYEYKIEAIEMLQDAAALYTRSSAASRKASEKPLKQKDTNLFLSINIDLLNQAIAEKLATRDYNKGFVLQSLKNKFVKDELTMLLMLLQIMGHVEYSLFINFFNDISNCINREKELKLLDDKKSEDALAEKIKGIDEMSLNDYENLDEKDRRIYLDAILPERRKDALERQMRFYHRVANVKKLENPSTSKNSTIKSAKDKKSKTAASKSESVKKKGKIDKSTSTRGSVKTDRLQTEEKEKELILMMDNYYYTLKKIENVIHYWNPIKKIVDIPRKESKTPKTAKSKDKYSILGLNEIPFEKFHIWYVKASNPWDDRIYDSVLSEIKKNNFVNGANDNRQETTLDTTPIFFSVLSKKQPLIYPKNLNQAFQIYQLLPFTGEDSIEALPSTSSFHSNVSLTNNRRKRLRKAKKDKKLRRSDLSLVESKLFDDCSIENLMEESIKARWIMQPHEILKFKIHFLPEETGIFEETYIIGLNDGSNQNYVLNINGISDIPRISMDPKMIFPRVSPSKINQMHEPTYFLDSDYFDFGLVAVMEGDERIDHVEREFKFYNTSEIDAIVKFSLEIDNSELFTIHPEELKIKAAETGYVIVAALATKLGLHSDRLIVQIEDNPSSESIELRANGVPLIIELDQKQLNFGRVLLYRKEFRTITVYNKSPILIYWRIEFEIGEDSQITWTPINNILKAWTDQKIEFCYHAINIETILKKKLLFKAFLDQNRMNPIFIETILISSESYDVAIDIDYANPIDLKSVRVGHPITTCFNIKNRCLFEVRYTVAMEKNEKLARVLPKSLNLKKLLDIEPVSGTIEAQKVLPVYVTLTPNGEITLKESPILVLHILDATKENTIVAEFPLTVSLVAYYTRFRIYPSNRVNFGSLGICTRKTMYLNIENIGHFPLHYSIHAVPDTQPAPHYVTQYKKESLSDRRDSISTRKSKDPSLKDKSPKIERIAKTVKLTREDASGKELKIGPFTVEKIKGQLDAGQNDCIPIVCYPECAGSQETEIILMVPDCYSKEDRTGKNITLMVDSCIPNIDFQDKDAIFYENYIVDHLEDFQCHRKIGPHSLYVRKENCLYIRRVPVWKTHVASLKLHNSNLIPVDIKVVFLPDESMPKNTESKTFLVTPEFCRIASTGSQRFTVSFTPSLIDTYRGKLEVSVELPGHLKSKKFRVKLIGESCIPEVGIMEPPIENGEAIMNFGRVLIGDVLVKRFIVKNLGLVQAKVIIRVHKDTNSPFRFLPSTRSENTLMLPDEEGDWSTGPTVFRLLPEEKACFKIKFCPKEIGWNEDKICLTITDNPYENLILRVQGESYFEIIALQDLPLVELTSVESQTKLRKNSLKRSKEQRLSALLVPSLIYLLNYDRCDINKMYKKNFKIANKSADRCFRFQWLTHPDVVIEPSIGHLKPLTEKSCTASFFSLQPVQYTNVPIDCTIYEIKLIGEINEIPWDEKQTIVNPTPNDNIPANTSDRKITKEVVEPIIEPDHEAIPNTMKIIRILLNSIVDFSKYSCNVSDIEFEDTLIYQTRTYEFTLSNNGVVDLRYKWKIDVGDQYPTRPKCNVSLEDSEETRNSSFSLDYRDILSSSCEPSGRTCTPRPNLGSKEIMELHNIEVSFLRKVMEESSSTSCQPSDLFSNTAERTDRTTDSWFESDGLPFTISPGKGTIKPGESIKILLKFSPIDFWEYAIYLTCKIENLDPDLPKLVISATAKGLLPFCHFDIPDSDYLTNNRRSSTMSGPIDYDLNDQYLFNNTKVIEFNIFGVGDIHIKKFNLINITRYSYNFSWTNKTGNFDGDVQKFQCLTPEGKAESGKKAEMCFSFLADNIGTYESFWLFSIKQLRFECLFLFVGIVKEPSVYCQRNYIKMKPTVLGINVQDFITIVNNEEISIPYEIQEDSLYSEGSQECLTVNPMSGILSPKKEQSLKIDYNPLTAGEHNYLVKCFIKTKTKPLIICVTTMSYDLNFTVSYINKDEETILLNKNIDNVIDLGNVILKQPVSIKFIINNIGSVSFFYTWDLGITTEVINKNQYTITAQESKGLASQNNKSICHLIITMLRKTLLKEHTVLLKISRGPTYRITLKAFAKCPAVHFNLTHLNFGPCYIEESNLYNMKLHVTNCENTPMILECNYEEKPYLSVKTENICQAIPPNSSVDIVVIFKPSELIIYEENIKFLIDSLYEKEVIVTGEGINYQVNLVDPRQKLVYFNNVPVGKSVTKQISIVNGGRAPVEFTLHLCEDNLSEMNKDFKESGNLQSEVIDTKDVAVEVAENIKKIISISPMNVVTLRPGKKMTVVVQFNPTQKIQPFSKRITLKTATAILDLFKIHASCIAADFNLTKTFIQFGIVVVGCSSSEKVFLINEGDIGAKFKWNLSTLSSNFKIQPDSGYSFPGKTVNFVVTFAPVREGIVREEEVTIEIEKFGSLHFKVAGGSCRLPEPKQTIKFTTNVRKYQTIPIEIPKNSNFISEIMPEISGDYFTISNFNSTESKIYVTYQPLTMTINKDPHKGMLIVKIPNDIAPIIYALEGNSTSPEPIRKIVRQFPAKRKHVEVLRVNNWLNKKQSFNCTIEELHGSANKNQKQKKILYTFTGNNRIDVFANSTRDYQAVFYSYEQADLFFKVIFTNSENEYQYYEIQYEIIEPEVIETIKLFTVVRRPLFHTILIDNPLEEESIIYTVYCENPSITISDTKVKIPPLGKENIKIEYFPLLETKEVSIKLDIVSEKLGRFPFILCLKANPPFPEKTTQITAMLGFSNNFSLLIKNYAKQDTSFSLMIPSSCFICPESIIEVPAGKEHHFDITYEPSNATSISSTLIASSDIAGDFIFPIIGSYSFPKPQGPFTVSMDKPVSITLKNIFEEIKTFEIYLDEPEFFSSSVSSADVEAKEALNIVISLRQLNREIFYPVTGKVIISCKNLNINNLKWIYYLKGIYD